MFTYVELRSAASRLVGNGSKSITRTFSGSVASRPCTATFRRIGHALSDDQGRFLSVDAGFSEIMRAPIASLVGRTILDITAPADRPDTAARIDWLRLAETPFTVRKRYLRDDGTLAWVENHVSSLRDGAGPLRIIATITQLSPAPSPCVPGQMLHGARLLLESRRRRDRLFDADLFSDPAWDLLLALYVGEAEGRILTASSLSGALTLSAATAGRWVRLLLDGGLIEAEEPLAGDFPAMPLRLSGNGHGRLERYLAEMFDWHQTAQRGTAIVSEADELPGATTAL